MAKFLNRNIRTFLATQFRMSSDQVDIPLKGYCMSDFPPYHLHRRKEQEQLAALRRHHKEEIDHHQKEIERLQQEISRHEGKIRKLKQDD
uniref:Uncharacterized protein n=1 Tax=Cyprinus carpio TaxID=7962 RepID=A0A8C1RCC6_CYPCA